MKPRKQSVMHLQMKLKSTLNVTSASKCIGKECSSKSHRRSSESYLVAIWRRL